MDTITISKKEYENLLQGKIESSITIEKLQSLINFDIDQELKQYSEVTENTTSARKRR